MKPDEIIDTYCSAWNEPDGPARMRLLEAVWAAGGTYTDPTANVTGIVPLSDHIREVQARFPGGRVERTSAVDHHNNVARFTWRMAMPDGTSLPEGTDLAVFAPDGRIERIAGFFGAINAAEE
jgi:hypothetical protein